MRIQLKLLIPINVNGWIEFMQLDSLHLLSSLMAWSC